MNSGLKRSFLIVGTQRTGSSALGEALGLHPQIACGWEWSQGLAPWRVLTVAERGLAGDFSAVPEWQRGHAVDSFSEGKSVLGFRRLFRSSDKWLLHPRFAPALWADRFEAHLKWLASRPDIRILHIVRRDNLGWLRSKALSAASGQYFGARYPENLRVTISIFSAVQRLKAKAWVDSRLASLRNTNGYLQIVHEDFLADNRSHVSRAVEFLGCDPGQLPELRMKAVPQSGKRSNVQVRNMEQLKGELIARGLLTASF